MGLLLRRDIFLQTWAAQNILKSPHPAHYLLAYGLLLPFVFLGLRGAWRQERGDGLMLLGWAVLLPVLAYAPTVIQRRLPEGGWVVLAILAAIGLGGAHLSDLGRWRLAGLALALSMVSPALLLFGAFRVAAGGLTPTFRPANQVAAFEWLAENAESGAVVLTGFQTGNALPAWAPDFVVIGHGPESAGLAGAQAAGRSPTSPIRVSARRLLLCCRNSMSTMSSSVMRSARSDSTPLTCPRI